ncbi:hypothetical protein HanIR_Chr02g0054111 [Helianthus annuus]|nr:hypothetical protein HanIR_Chr02g0054111 [Helianthus annuus]
MVQVLGGDGGEERRLTRRWTTRSVSVKAELTQLSSSGGVVMVGEGGNIAKKNEKWE